MHEHDRFFAVTGGPGAGKTSLIAWLAARGLRHSVEAGRAIIQDQVAKGGTDLPWADRESFAVQMRCHEVQSYESARAQEGTFTFDRGFADIVGFRRLAGLPPDEELTQAARLKRYNRLVFAAPPWRQIFVRDAERTQSFAEAQATYDAVTRAWIDLGYDLVELPLVPVEARAEFVLRKIEASVGIKLTEPDCLRP